MQVKKPEESDYPWDDYKPIQTMFGEQAFGKRRFDLPAGGTHQVRPFNAKARPVPTGSAWPFSGINRFTALRKMR